MFCFSVEGSSPWWTELVRKGALCRHGDHDDYACFGGRAPTLGLEGLEFDVREPSCKECVGPWLHRIMPDLKRAALQKLNGCAACLVLKGPRVVRLDLHGQVAGFCSFYSHREKPNIIHS
jgi:hypothetical protein